MNTPTSMERLTLREFFLFALVIVITTLACIAAAEVGTRIAFPEQLVDHCSGGPGLLGHKADCELRLKAAEGSWIDFRFNECGFRSPSCAPTSGPRLVSIGSSTSFGYLVSYDDTWSVKAARALSKECGTPIDVQNTGGEDAWGDLNVVTARASELKKLNPTAVALVITPFDLFRAQPEGTDPAAIIAAARGQGEARKLGPLERARVLLKESRATQMAQHYLFGNPDIYINSYLLLGDKADFLREPLTLRWQKRLEHLDHAVRTIAEHAAAASAPLYLVLAPTEAQAELLGERNQQRAKVDASLLVHEVRAIATRNQAVFVDATTPFEQVKDTQDYFYRSEGHLNSLGHAVLAQAMITAVEKSNGIQQLCRNAR